MELGARHVEALNEALLNEQMINISYLSTYQLSDLILPSHSHFHGITRHTHGVTTAPFAIPQTFENSFPQGFVLVRMFFPQILVWLTHRSLLKCHLIRKKNLYEIIVPSQHPLNLPDPALFLFFICLLSPNILITHLFVYGLSLPN